LKLLIFWAWFVCVNDAWGIYEMLLMFTTGRRSAYATYLFGFLKTQFVVSIYLLAGTLRAYINNLHHISYPMV